MRGEAPYRRAVIMQRNTRNVLVEDQWEEWEDLSFRQQWRRSHPSYLNITVFACNPNAEVASSAKPVIQEVEPAGPSQSATLDGSSVDAAMPEPMHPMPSPARVESQETASESCEPTNSPPQRTPSQSSADQPDAETPRETENDTTIPELDTRQPHEIPIPDDTADELVCDLLTCHDVETEIGPDGQDLFWRTELEISPEQLTNAMQSR